MRTANLSTGNRGGIIITHREYIADVRPTSEFTKTEYDLNPGITATFPWLAELAKVYVEYKVKGIVYEFKSLCSSSTTNSVGTLGMGSVIMATNYNPLEDPFTDKRTMENYEGSSSKKPQESNIHVVDLSKGQTPIPGLKWIRTGPTPPDADIRLYDIGKFCIATQGQPSDVLNGVIGELWVAYEIEFFKPRISGAIGAALRLSHWNLQIPAGGYTTVYPFGFYNAPIPDIVGNKLNVGGVLLAPSVAGGLGYNTIKFDRTMIGMTFLVYVFQRSVNAKANLSQLVFDDGASDGIELILGFGNQLVPNNTAIATNEEGITAATYQACIKLKVIDDGTGKFNLCMNFSDAHGSLEAACRMDIYVMQINGSLDSI